MGNTVLAAENDNMSQNDEIKNEIHAYNYALSQGIMPMSERVANYWGIIPTTNHGDVWVPSSATVPGTSSYYTKLLQACLNRLGYNAGTVDGIYGDNTRNAIIRFQRANGLSQDGVAGEITWAYIDIRIDSLAVRVEF